MAACGTAMRMCETLYSAASDGAFFCRSRYWSISRGVTAMRWIHVALAQQRERELLAHGVAIGGVVDALRRERFGQLRQRDLVALGDFRQRVVQRLVGHLDAGALGALHLQLLQDQALEHLLAQHVLRRQLELLLPQALGDRGDLLVELAGEHDAVVHDGGDPVEQHAAGGQLARLGDAQRASSSEGDKRP